MSYDENASRSTERAAPAGEGPWEVVLNVAHGCFDYGGGYRSDDEKLAIFHHGIQTVINALEAAQKNGLGDTQIAALHAVGRQARTPDPAPPPLPERGEGHAFIYSRIGGSVAWATDVCAICGLLRDAEIHAVKDSTHPKGEPVPLCPIHKQIEDRGNLEMTIGGLGCVACSLTEREELLALLAPFAPEGGTEDSLAVMRRVTEFYDTHKGSGRVVVSYPAPQGKTALVGDVLSDKERALLNKVFRAVHDHVCPSCGNDMQFMDGRYYECGMCKFRVTAQEMMRMQPIIQQWGKEAVEYFERWRGGRLETTK